MEADRRTFLQAAGLTAAGLVTPMDAQSGAPAAAAQSQASPRSMGRFRDV